MNSSPLLINGVPIDRFELLQLITTNKKLHAIKRLREQAQIGVKESKNIVDFLERDSNFHPKNIGTMSTKIELNDSILNIKQQRFRKGSHLFQDNTSRKKNVMIVFLLATIIIMMYFFFIA